MTHSNADVINAYLKEAKHNLQSIRSGQRAQELYISSFISPDCAGHYAGKSKLAGWYRPGDFITNWGTFMARFKSTILEVKDILDSKDRAIALLRERLEATGGDAIEFERIAIYRLEKGVIVEVQIRDNDQQDVDAFIDRH